MLDLSTIAKALGGEIVRGKVTQVIAPGPGHSPQDRSLAVRLSDDAPCGFIAHSHAGDDWRTCRDYVLQRLGLSWRDMEQRPRVTVSAMKDPNDDSDDERNREQALKWWREAREPRGTIIDLYLGARRLELTDDIANNVVRYHPACPFGPGTRHPCMLTLFRDIKTDKPMAIQRTALRPDGGKIDRKMFGPVAGAAIKIDANENVTMGLHIGEGFETCLAARLLDMAPVWAVGSVDAIRKFPVLSGIEALTLLAETGDVSERAVKECATRWHDAGREVWIIRPKIGDDVNDALMLATVLQ